MKRISLFLRKMTILVKVAFGRQTVTAMTDNLNFPEPDPTLDKLSEVCTRLETAYNDAESARQIAKEKTAIQNQVEDEFDETINKMANYVETTSGGDEAKILSANMTPKSKGVRNDELPDIPQHLSVTLSDMENEMDLMWDPVDGASSYNIFMSTDGEDPTKWNFVKSSTGSMTKITGLTTGQRYWFRVAALNTNGQGAYSETVSKVRW